MPLNEHVYCVAVPFKMTEQVQQVICIKFYIKHKHSSMETIQMSQKAAAMGNWWLAASSQQCAHSCILSRAEFFGETSTHSGDSVPLQPRFGALQLLVFLKTKIPFEREQISDHGWDSGKYKGQLMVIGRTVWGPKVPTLRELRCHCPMYNVSCNVYLLQ